MRSPQKNPVSQPLHSSNPKTAGSSGMLNCMFHYELLLVQQRVLRLPLRPRSPYFSTRKSMQKVLRRGFTGAPAPEMPPLRTPRRFWVAAVWWVAFGHPAVLGLLLCGGLLSGILLFLGCLRTAVGLRDFFEGFSFSPLDFCFHSFVLRPPLRPRGPYFCGRTKVCKKRLRGALPVLPHRRRPP